MRAWMALTTAAILAFTVPAMADIPMPPSVRSCLVNKVNKQDILACYDTETARLEAQLPLGSQAWKKKRNEACSQEGDKVGGSGGDAVISYCIMNRTVNKVHAH